MRTILSYLFAAVLVVGLAGGVWRFLEEREQSQLEQLISSFPGASDDSFQREQLWDAALELVGKVPLSAQSMLTLAELQRQISQAAVRQDSRNMKLCQALHYVGNAISISPYQAQLLLNWANLRQVLGRFDCQLPNTSGDFMAVVDYALALNRSDPELAFSAGLVFHFAGDRERALAAFKNAFTIGKQLNVAQQEFVAGLIQNPKDLLAAIPALLQQVLLWSSYYKTRHPDRFKSFSGAFAKLQGEALVEATQRYRQGMLPGERYHDGLMALIRLSAGDKVRRSCEQALQPYLKMIKQPQLARYLLSRSKYSRLAVVPGSSLSDTRPLRGSLFMWGRDYQTALDSYYTSLGFYLTEKQSVRLLELCARPGSAWPDEKQVKVLVSEDNQIWQELSNSNGFTRIKIGDQPCLVQWLKGGRDKYWKVHFSSGDRINKFRNSAVDFVNVYGLVRH